MEDDLPGSYIVIHMDVHPICVHSLFYRYRKSLHDLTESLTCLSVEIVDILVMLFRYQERMAEVVGLKIEEGHKILIFVELCRWYIPANYFTKYAIIHMCSYQPRYVANLPNWSKREMSSSSLPHISHGLPRNILHVRP